ncbi:MAG: hypothetical protein OXU29_08210 [Gammaproteobacteria bacterium]|nr:hypothetical protein [Gammaproteobacteria bacterium]MDD9850310.1 hypothetical protein [Gammaproteobacteria bacterium]MDD9870921.1 hypothetical protein [Gammaproteobacteria bacterium]
MRRGLRAQQTRRLAGAHRAFAAPRHRPGAGARRAVFPPRRIHRQARGGGRRRPGRPRLRAPTRAVRPRRHRV